MKVMSSQDWARRGYRIRTGARSYTRGAGGVAMFTRNQVTPWDYVPAHFNAPPAHKPNIIQVNGRYYREI